MRSCFPAFLALGSAVAFTCACKDRSASVVNVAPPPSTSPAPKPSAPAATSSPAPAPPADMGFVNDPNIEMLTIAISGYFSAKGTVPKDVDELVRAKFLERAPTPPPGKKYAVDPVKRIVKVVSQ
jgi:hypothetical protein